jgi:DNA-binding HxlR family transcriptional regulator
VARYAITVSPTIRPTARVCSVNDALGVLADRYTLAIVRELLYGNRRFGLLVEQLAAPRSILSSRLNRLEEAGVVERRRYSEHPPRDEYLLTDAGQELVPLLLALKQWGDRHCRDGEQTAIFTHSCGSELHVETVCAACREPVAFPDLKVTGGSHPPEIHAGPQVG